WDICLHPHRYQDSWLLASASSDGTVKIWNTEDTKSPLRTSLTYDGYYDAVSSTGKRQTPYSSSFWRMVMTAMHYFSRCNFFFPSLFLSVKFGHSSNLSVTPGQPH